MNVNTDITLEEGLDLYSTKMNAAMQVLSQKGFVMHQPPMFVDGRGAQVPYRGELPPDLTALSDDQLGWYMGLITQWAGYCSEQLAEADTNWTSAKAALDLVEAKLRIIYQKDPSEGKKRSNPERDDYVKNDRRYNEARADVIYWETIYTYTKAIANNAEGAYAAVSRRVTQRGQEVDRLTRTGNVTGHTNLPQGRLFGGYPGR